MRRLLLLLAAMGLIVLAVLLATRPGGDHLLPLPDNQPDRGSGTLPGEDPGPSTDAGESRRGEIFGTVRFAGAPVAAHVELRRLPLTDPHHERWKAFAETDGSEPAFASVDSGGLGSFVFPGLDTGRYELRGSVGDATGAASVEIRHPGEGVSADILIPSGPEALTGRAVWEDGRPFEGLVAVVDAERTARLPGTSGVRPDGKGRFSIPGLDAGVVRVTCHLPGKLRYLSRKVRIPQIDEFLVVVDGGTKLLTGRVVAGEDGAPIASAEVRAWGDTAQDRRHMVATRTDEAGRFTMRLLPIWRRLTVHARGFSPVTQGIDDGVEQVEIRLGRAGSVSGRVLSADDRRPLSGISVHTLPLDPYHPDPGGRTTTDARGRFVLESLPNCEVMLYAQGAGWITPGVGAASEVGANPLAVRVAPGAAARIDLLVVRAFQLRGSVVDERGEGVVGIPVRASTWDALDSMAGRTSEAVTDELGRFFFDALVPEMVYALQAMPPGRGAVKSGAVVGSSGETVEVLIKLTDETSPPRWLDLRVVETSSGNPIPGARVSGGGLGGWTDSKGRARLGPFPPGRVGIWVYHPDYMLLQDRPILEEASGVLSHIVRLRRGLAITGRVLLPDGRPLENGKVWVNAVDAPEDSGPGGSTIAEVTAGGRFRAGGLLAGKYRVKIGGTHDRGGYWVEQVVRAGEEDLVLTTERYVGPEKQTLLLEIVDPEGQPVPRCTADIRFKREDFTWEDEYEVHGGETPIDFWDRITTVTISVSGARTSSGAPLPFGPVLHGPIPLRAGKLEIRLTPESVIEGVVRTPDGRGVRGVRIGALPTYAEALEFDNPHFVAFTDDRGSFRLSGLGATEYRLTVSVPPEYSPVEPVITSPGTGKVRIEIIRGATVRLTVLDTKRTPLPGAWVTADTADDGPWRRSSTVARADGTALLTGLDSARPYSLEVTPPSGRRDLLPVTVSDWTPADGEVVLRPGRYVSGVVREKNGERASGVVVYARFQGDRWVREEVARDGSFCIGPYGEGLLELEARRKDAPLSGPDPKRVIRVAVGAENVALTVAPGRTLVVRILNWRSSYGPVRASLMLSGSLRWAIVEADGTATFTGLPLEGVATVFVGPVGEGLHLLIDDICADFDSVSGSLTSGGSISGRLILPPGAEDAGVRLSGPGFTLTASVAQDGTFRFTGVPKGLCVVTAQAMVDRRLVEGGAWTEVGGTVRIELGTR